MLSLRLRLRDDDPVEYEDAENDDDAGDRVPDRLECEDGDERALLDRDRPLRVLLDFTFFFVVNSFFAVDGVFVFAFTLSVDLDSVLISASFFMAIAVLGC